MNHAIRIHQYGGPEVLQWEEVQVGDPGAGEIRLKQTAVGLNYIDVYHRTGEYPQPLPFVPGMSAAGIVESVGKGVVHLKPGDRVAYPMEIGAYAEARLLYRVSNLLALSERSDVTLPPSTRIWASERPTIFPFRRQHLALRARLPK